MYNEEKKFINDMKASLWPTFGEQKETLKKNGFYKRDIEKSIKIPDVPTQNFHKILLNHLNNLIKPNFHCHHLLSLKLNS